MSESGGGSGFSVGVGIGRILSGIGAALRNSPVPAPVRAAGEVMHQVGLAAEGTSEAGNAAVASSSLIVALAIGTLPLSGSIAAIAIAKVAEGQETERAQATIGASLSAWGGVAATRESESISSFPRHHHTSGEGAPNR
jgi:hypothetical protein